MTGLSGVPCLYSVRTFVFPEELCCISYRDVALVQRTIQTTSLRSHYVIELRISGCVSCDQGQIVGSAVMLPVVQTVRVYEMCVVGAYLLRLLIHHLYE